MSKRITVIGGGSWGTALAMVLARAGQRVALVTHSEAQAETLNSERQNRAYLPDIMFPERLQATGDLQRALDGAEACVLALPCSAVPSVLPALAGDYPVIVACKGLNPETLQRPDQLLESAIARSRIVLLSGPSFALEVARGQPTAITMASDDIAMAAHAASFFDDTNFRIYTCDDVIGVAMGGALKNVIAIAAGIAEGLGLGHNSMAAVVTRGLSEMARIACAVGGRNETLMGLSGIGDLVLTCTGALSRNRRLGMLLAEGLDVATAEQRIGQAVEGVRTADAVDRLARQVALDVPLMQSVAQVLRGDMAIAEAVCTLMNRPERREFE